MVPLSNFDLKDAASESLYERSLQAQLKHIETGIINLDYKTGPRTHWVAYAIDPHAIVYFDSYGSALPKEFMRSKQQRKISDFSTPVFDSTLSTQNLNDLPICGRKVLNVLAVISSSRKPPHVVVNEYTSGKVETQNVLERNSMKKQ